jgi:hypothetical protein
VDFDGALHSDLYDGFRLDFGGNELVAGTNYDFARQYNRSRADSSQFASGNEIRHSVSRVCSRRLRHIRLKSSGDYAGDCRLRVVRDSGVDWRAGDSYIFRVRRSKLEHAFGRRNQRTHADRMVVVFDFLGDEHFYYLSRNGFIAARRKLGCAVCAGDDRRAARVDFVPSGRRWVFIE